MFNHASENGNFSLCRLIIENAEEKNPKGKDGITQLHIAVQKGNTSLFQLIFENAKDKNPADNKGMTPLHLAVQYKRWSICDFILKNVEDIHPKNIEGMTPFDFIDGHRKMLHLFQQAETRLKKADTNNHNSGNSSTSSGNTDDFSSSNESKRFTSSVWFKLNEVQLFEVDATIVRENQETIYIYSKTASYNKINNSYLNI